MYSLRNGGRVYDHVEAYEGSAHTALGYCSWGAYLEADVGGK